MEKTPKQWSETALAIIRQALSEQEGTPTGKASPMHPIRRMSSGMSAVKRNSALHVGDQTIVGKLLRLGREQEQVHEQDGDNARGLPDSAHAPALEEGRDDSRDRGHLVRSGMWDEKEEEGFVMARGSRDLQQDQHVATEDDELLGECSKEGTADAGGDTMQNLLDVSERLQKTLRTQNQVSKRAKGDVLVNTPKVPCAS